MASSQDANFTAQGNGRAELNIPRRETKSLLSSIINMTAILIGLGQISMPYALQEGGWVSSFILIFLGIVCTYTSHLLGKCLARNNSLTNYSDIGHQAFGRIGKVIISIFNYLEIFMALVSFTISLHDNINTVFAGKHVTIPRIPLSTSQLLTTIAVIVALPSVWLKNVTRISFLSVIGVIASITIFIAVVCTPLFSDIKANHAIPVLRFHNIPVISGLYIFSFSTHVVFPNIYRSMEDPTRFTKVSIVSFAIVTSLYTTLAFVGARIFGPNVSPQVTLSMPKHLIITQIALWATIIAPLTKYAFALIPMASQLDNILPNSMGHRMRSILPNSMGHRMRSIIRSGIASLLLLLVLILALTVPHFEEVLGLTGSLVSTCVSIIFPCAFYVRIFWFELSTSRMVLHIVILIIGLSLGIMGTISSAKALIKSF